MRVTFFICVIFMMKTGSAKILNLGRFQEASCEVMGGNCTNVNECILKDLVAMPGKCVRQELDLESGDETACCFDLFGIYGGKREDTYGSGVIAADESQQQRTSPFNMFKDSTCEE